MILAFLYFIDKKKQTYNAYAIMSKNCMLMEHLNVVQSSSNSFIQFMDIKWILCTPCLYFVTQQNWNVHSDMFNLLLKCTTEQGLVLNPDRQNLEFEVASLKDFRDSFPATTVTCIAEDSTWAKVGFENSKGWINRMQRHWQWDWSMAK